MHDQVKSQQTKRGNGMDLKNNIITLFIIGLILMGNVMVSCAQKGNVLNPPKLIELTVKDFSDDLGLEEGQLGKWRLVDTDNRTLIIVTEGDKISWTAGQSDLQFQFPEKLSRRLFNTVEGDPSIFRNIFSFTLEAGETLTVEVQQPQPEGIRDLYELTYALLHVEDGELVATDSPPKIIFMF